MQGGIKEDISCEANNFATFNSSPVYFLKESIS